MGFWKPISHKQHDDEVVDVGKLEEQTAQLERDLITKERETLDVLKELESTKNTVEELKLKLQNEASEINAPGFILLELKQAKLNLTRTTNDLADIRATVDLYNKKIEDERLSLEKTRKRLSSNTSKISSLEDEQLSSETEQFKKAGQAAKVQVQKALSEIEQTRARIKTAEARLIAAKRMKEAARASERVALAEIKALSKSNEHQQKPENIITLTLDEYTSLISKARESERACEGRVEDTTDKLAVEEALRVWRSEHGRKRRSVQNSVKFKKESQSRLCDVNGLSLVNDEPVLKPTLSIGQILSRKLMLTEEYENGMGKRKVSLGQMLGKKSGKENKEQQQLPVKRKKFGFARISLLVAKQNKKNKKNLNASSIFI
ncbi:WEB family protein at2g38370 [Phtheirospermum japonicum]|uniref:WEB family protein at2g38370 n=1 Tax=Phtheirospermum japonicum TaxID=374723 RepID=A0A830B6D4_9LAMI|nr:WEB family protein at2g38370 [Phtheirospermum japonicum]